MRGRKQQVFADFDKGVNLVDGPYGLAKGEASDALNVTSDGRGGIRSRGASESVAIQSPPLPFIVPLEAGSFPVVDASYVLSLVTDEQAAAAGTATVRLSYLNPDNTTTLVDLRTRPSGSPFFKNPKVAFGPEVNSQGPIYILATRVDDQGIELGEIFLQGAPDRGVAAWAGDASMPAFGQCLLYHNNRMFIGNGGTLFASEVGDPATWDSSSSTAYAVRFGPDESPILALVARGDYVLAFTVRGVHVVYDTETGANRLLDGAAGCTYADAAIDTPAGVFYLGSDRRVYLTDGQSVKWVSRKIQPFLDAHVPDLAIVPAASVSSKTWSAAWLEDRLLLQLDPGASTNYVVEYVVTTDSWWIHSLPQYANLASFKAHGAIYASASGRLHKLFSRGDSLRDADASSDFEAYWQPPELPLGAPALKKRINAVDIDATASVSVEVGKDGDALQAHAITGRRALSLGVARRWALRFSFLTAGMLRSLTVAFTPGAN